MGRTPWIRTNRTEWLNARHLVLGFFFLGFVHPYIESAPTQPNKYYHTAGVNTFRFRFPTEKSHLDEEQLVSNENGGAIKLALQHKIHPTMINSTSSTKWIRKVVLHSLERDKHRANALMAANSTYNNQSSASANAPLASGNLYGASFIVRVGLGTPTKKEIMMMVDTANDVSWLKCNYRGKSFSYKRVNCHSCNRQVEGMACNHHFNQCNYEMQFRDGAEIKAHMSEDTLWLGSQSFPAFTFGCGYDFNGLESDLSVGLLALGRNALSLPSQTESQYQRKFSYCLPNFLNPHQTGSLKLGLGSIPPTSKFTTLLSNPRATSWYFVGLTGISVAGQRLKISRDVFQFNSQGGGTIIDSGVLIGRLVQPAYDALKAAFLPKMSLVPVNPPLQTPLDTCFNYTGNIKKLKIPGITFHFQDGLHVRIHKEGILTAITDNTICLAIGPANDFSIIGSLQQQRYIVSFDEQNKKIGFASVRTCV